MKLKKRMSETKKRLKLVGKSNQSLFEGSGRRISIGMKAGNGEVVQDDVDAEGDADEEADVEMQVQ